MVSFITVYLDVTTRGQCYGFENSFAKTSGEKVGFLSQNTARLCKKMNHNIDFLENANFLTKIA
jgi:hypothetical protein